MSEAIGSPEFGGGPKLDLLRVHHERIEAWILEQAGVQLDVKAAPTIGLSAAAPTQAGLAGRKFTLPP